MRFMVERDTLAEAVAWVARALPSRPVLPVLSGLLLQAAGCGKARHPGREARRPGWPGSP